MARQGLATIAQRTELYLLLISSGPTTDLTASTTAAGADDSDPAAIGGSACPCGRGWPSVRRRPLAASSRPRVAAGALVQMNLDPHLATSVARRCTGAADRVRYFADPWGTPECLEAPWDRRLYVAAVAVDTAGAFVGDDDPTQSAPGAPGPPPRAAGTVHDSSCSSRWC